MTQMKKTELALTGLKGLMRGQTYVEVRLVVPAKGQRKERVITKYTSTMDGNYPDWNETLEFPLVAENGKGFSEDELIESGTTLYFSLFDRDMKTKEVAYTNNFETTVENKFLGSFSIGLLSIL